MRLKVFDGGQPVSVLVQFSGYLIAAYLMRLMRCWDTNEVPYVGKLEAILLRARSHTRCVSDNLSAVLADTDLTNSRNEKRSSIASHPSPNGLSICLQFVLVQHHDRSTPFATI